MNGDAPTATVAVDAAVRVWVMESDDDDGSPQPRVSVAVDDGRMTVTGTAWPTAECLRGWARSLRHEADHNGTRSRDGASVSLHARSDGGALRTNDGDGCLTVGWPLDGGPAESASVSTGDSDAADQIRF